MNDFTKVELTQEQYERLKNEYDARALFRDRHFIESREYRSSAGYFFKYIGPNQRLKRIAQLEENEQFYKRKIEDLESQVKGFQKDKERRWWWGSR